MIQHSPIAQLILELLFEGGCVSKSSLLCLPYSYRNISVQLKKLIDSNWIQLYGKGKLKRYRLLSLGMDYLKGKNEERFSSDRNSSEQMKTNLRSMTLGDTLIFLKLAGYGTHFSDKPLLPAYTPYMQDSPANDKQLYRNYYTDSYDGHMKYDTPINCFYTAQEVKTYAENRAPSGTRSIQYSRTTGVLYTPDRIYRLYHTRDVALDFRPTGEANLEALVGELFTGHTPELPLGTIVLGYSFEAAEKILAQGLDAYTLRMARIHGGSQKRLNGSNLSSHLIYFPVRKESIPPLQLMRFPNWQSWLNNYIATNLFPKMTPAEVGFFLGEEDGYNLFNGLYLNLTHFSVILSNLYNSDKQQIAILCFEWQREFYETMLERYTIPGNSYEIYELSSQDFEQIVKTYEEYWKEKS